MAAVETSLGNALRQRGDLVGALAAYGRARALYRALMEEEGQRHVIPEFCMTLSGEVLALDDEQAPGVAPIAARQGEVVAEVLRFVRQCFGDEAGLAGLPERWRRRLVDLLEVAAGASFVPEEARKEVRQRLSELQASG